MPADPIIGWDVGGAHLKAARLDPEGTVAAVVQVACPLWQGLSHLATALSEACAVVGEAPAHAITMTGEMADLFASRRAGVVALAAALDQRFSASRRQYFAGAMGFVTPTQVPSVAEAIASANWRATAELVATRLPDALLVDIGSTTTDLVPIAGGRVVATGAGDYGRLVGGELVYSGVVRTPLMALGADVPFGADRVPLMAEYFATTADVYRVTGELPPGADLHPTADGGPKTLLESTRRLGRMIGRDLDSAPASEWLGLARGFRELQLRRLLAAGERQLARAVLPARAPVVGVGVGRFLVPELAARWQREAVEFAAVVAAPAPLASPVADCAPAVAVACLARAHHGP